MFEIKKELLVTHEALLNVEVEEAVVKKAMEKAARAISGEYNIPGFRRGKAPYSRILHFFGEPAVRERAADLLLEEIYPQIIDQAEIAPYGPGQLDDVKWSPLVFTIRVPLEPEVTLGDYQNLRLDWQEAAVTDEEMDSVADQIREEHAILEPLERPAQLGDEVHINVLGSVGDDVFVDEDDIEVRLSTETPFISAEFVDALVGMSVDEEKSFAIVFPEDFNEETLRGTEAQFDVKIVGVYERILPDFDDALASTVGAFETIDALKQDIHTRLLEAKRQQTQESYRDALVAVLVEQAEVHYPAVALEETLDDMIKDATQRVQRERHMSLEDALQLEGLTLAQFRGQITPQAESNIKRSLVLSEFARQQGVDVTDDDIVQEFNRFVSTLGNSSLVEDMNFEIDSPLGRNLRSGLLGRKTLERLEKIGRGEVEAVDLAAEVPSADDVSADDVSGDDVAAEEPVVEEESATVEETSVEAEDAA